MDRRKKATNVSWYSAFGPRFELEIPEMEAGNEITFIILYKFYHSLNAKYIIIIMNFINISASVENMAYLLISFASLPLQGKIA
jgi:hypothetical protein